MTDTPATPAIPAPAAPVGTPADQQTPPVDAVAASSADQGTEAVRGRRRVRLTAVPQGEAAQPAAASGEAGPSAPVASQVAAGANTPAPQPVVPQPAAAQPALPQAAEAAPGPEQAAAATADGAAPAPVGVPQPTEQPAEQPGEQPAPATAPGHAAPQGGQEPKSPAAVGASTQQAPTQQVPAQPGDVQAPVADVAAPAAQNPAPGADPAPAAAVGTPADASADAPAGTPADGTTASDTAPAAGPGTEPRTDADAEAGAVGTADGETAAGTAPATADGTETGNDTEIDTEIDTEDEGESTIEAETDPAPGYGESDREAVHRVMRERRDVRTGFRSDAVPDEVLIRVLEAAHHAPSVGFSQPWDFVVIRNEETRAGVQRLAARQREAYAASLPKARAKQFLGIKTEAILETPVNIVVTVDSTRGGRHTLGRHTQPQMGPYSSALAVENLWLAARAEGLGVGWVSFFDERELSHALGLPEHLEIVAYLCVGYVDAFPDEPELEQSGWAKQRPLSWVVHEEEYGRRGLPGEDPVRLLDETIRSVRPLDAKALSAAWDRHKVMTKPAGSLGVLEMISAQLAGLSRTCPPPVPEPAAVAVFAADHGVHAQGVSPWPQEVTAQMVHNFLAGGAVVNAFARQIGVEVCVVDVGVAAELPVATGLLPRKVRFGTADMTQGPAMSREEVMRAIEVGIETARDLVTAGNRCLLTGDMGIANTTASAALIAVFTGTDAADVTGRGTGIDDSTHDRKVQVVRAALAKHAPDPDDPIGVLAAVGGLEHAALAGFIIGAAAMRTPVVLDGVIAGAAALAAHRIAPDALAACIAGHRSAEPGHAAALAKLGLRPLVELELRLGEGTGAVLALPLVQSAARVMHDVATFDSAGVSGKTG
ncbi:nicotinate-nucleotide--dimethylbenzimidazole phosphoribosyltransferase [Streptomycetaceae bacterium NBC_01309]